MKHEVVFDKNAATWSKEKSWNTYYLTNTQNYIKDQLRYRGYIYLNQIYEHLGLHWDISNDNPCILFDPYKELVFSNESLEGSNFKITMSHDYRH